jgi:hypothetical protein
VLLVEAGGSAPSYAEIPLNVAAIQRSALDWQYKTVRQEGVMASTGGQSRGQSRISIRRSWPV